MPKHSHVLPSKPIDEYDHPVPKKAFGRVLDDDRPIDDYENTVHEEEEAQKHAEERGPSPPNRAAARHDNHPHAAHQAGGREGTTSSKYRSVSKH
ncbi:hypothetical protein UA08_03856 [Talaromyces atroroseus]|uniref:Uncharacterized protein n=1 Tax=Talaromyces atroroseus TaxID=1441469 RepID=A0A225AIG2_TALAT|nr:hypothetical protein UA08_03856 [Talaromyces atroroseus]OKL61231.1 hypothetical protein UA08_03856 [Talaromyces atroroseus]